jgi:hypothetical protein
MKVSRFAALAALSCAFAGCHDDPQVITVLVPPAVQSFVLDTTGGSATSGTGLVGSGGSGGELRIYASGDVDLGTRSTVLTAPTPPAAPSTGTPLTAGLAGVPTAGNLLLSGTLSLDTTANPAVFTSTTGDIVISGTLVADDEGVNTDGITLNAPAGTVYISGTVRTASSDGTPDGDGAGPLVINARRIVITGAIDAGGEDHSGASGAGGGGGDVTLNSDPGQPVYILGTGIDASAGSGAASGGTGGTLTVNAGGALHVYAPLNADGGAAAVLATSPSALTPSAGDAGDVILESPSSVDVNAVISLRGGAATGRTAGAVGGTGGEYRSDTGAVYRIYGEIRAGGGAATATSLADGGGLIGGTGGIILFGQIAGGVPSNPLARIELGIGNYGTDGGSGQDASGGGDAGVVDIRSDDGHISLGSSLYARGGAGTGGGNASGGLGGTLVLETDNDFGGSAGTNGLHSISVPSTVTIDTGGGAAVGSGAAGNASAITLRCAGDLLCSGTLSALGGVPVTGIGGSGASILLRLQGNASAAGDLLVSGTLRNSGASSQGAAGGAAAMVMFDATSASPGGIVSSATIESSGGAGAVAGAGGTAGVVSFLASSGDLEISGRVTARGGSSAAVAGPQPGGSVNLSTGATSGSVICSAIVDVAGGASTATSLVNVDGGDGGLITAGTTDASGSLTFESGFSLSAAGGASTGANAATASTGGTATLTCSGPLATIGGSWSAPGGASSGVGGTGGAGGSFSLTHTGTAGTVTLSATVGLSGATGATGGAGGAFTVSATAASMTVSGALTLNGGAGDATGTGGAGGTASLSTQDEAVSVSSSVLAVGGSGATGGLGGRFSVLTDSDNDGVGGDITIASGATVSASGGTGTTAGGNARNNGAAGVETPPAGDVAIVLDADNSGGGDSGTAGRITFGGSLVASGAAIAGLGGDVHLEGRNTAGLDLAVGDVFGLTQTGPGGTGDLFVD